MFGKIFGKTIKMFLLDGVPNGRMTCELSNWTGKAYKIPRNRIKDCSDRTELSSTGVYLLFGKSDENSKDIVYIKALRGLGKIHMASGDLVKADKVMEDALRQAPEFPPLLLDVAKLRSALGKRDAAIAAYHKVIQVAPGSDLAVEAVKALSALTPGN